eukprot:scaffold133080_cov17-Tisochrysis_lutea.AAC.1
MAARRAWILSPMACTKTKGREPRQYEQQSGKGSGGKHAVPLRARAPEASMVKRAVLLRARAPRGKHEADAVRRISLATSVLPA